MSEELQAAIAKLDELIKDIEIAMLTTLDENGHLHSRPMATQKESFAGEIWFFTYRDSHKVLEVESDARVNVAYAAPDKNRFVSIAGRARLVTDAAKIHDLWKPVLKAWFPDGPETEGIALLKIEVETAEYWDSPASAVVKLAGFVKATLTGMPMQSGENEKIDLK